MPVFGKPSRRILSSKPVRNSPPSVVTAKLTSANSTPSANARRLWTPSPARFQLKVKPNPVSARPQVPAVSGRSVPWAVAMSGPPSRLTSTLPAAQTQPRIKPIPLSDDPCTGDSRAAPDSFGGLATGGTVTGLTNTKF